MFWFRVDAEMGNARDKLGQAAHQNRFESERHPREPLIQLGVRTLQEQLNSRITARFAFLICMRELCLIQSEEKEESNVAECLSIEFFPSLTVDAYQ